MEVLADICRAEFASRRSNIFKFTSSNELCVIDGQIPNHNTSVTVGNPWHSQSLHLISVTSI